MNKVKRRRSACLRIKSRSIGQPLRISLPKDFKFQFHVRKNTVQHVLDFANKQLSLSHVARAWDEFL